MGHSWNSPSSFEDSPSEARRVQSSRNLSLANRKFWKKRYFLLSVRLCWGSFKDEPRFILSTSKRLGRSWTDSPSSLCHRFSIFCARLTDCNTASRYRDYPDLRNLAYRKADHHQHLCKIWSCLAHDPPMLGNLSFNAIIFRHLYRLLYLLLSYIFVRPLLFSQNWSSVHRIYITELESVIWSVVEE